LRIRIQVLTDVVELPIMDCGEGVVAIEVVPLSLHADVHDDAVCCVTARLSVRPVCVRDGAPVGPRVIALVLLVRHADPDNSLEVGEVLQEGVVDKALRPGVLDGDEVSAVHAALLFGTVELQGVAVDELVTAVSVQVYLSVVRGEGGAAWWEGGGRCADWSSLGGGGGDGGSQLWKSILADEIMMSRLVRREKVLSVLTIVVVPHSTLTEFHDSAVVGRACGFPWSPVGVGYWTSIYPVVLSLALLVRHPDPHLAMVMESACEGVVQELLCGCVRDGDQVTVTLFTLTFCIVELQVVRADEIVAVGTVDI